MKNANGGFEVPSRGKLSAFCKIFKIHPKKKSLRECLFIRDVTKGFRATLSTSIIVICLKELKRDNEYLIAKKSLLGRTEPFVYILGNISVFFFATVHHSVPFAMRCYATCQQSRWWQTNSRITEKKNPFGRFKCPASDPNVMLRLARSLAQFTLIASNVKSLRSLMMLTFSVRRCINNKKHIIRRCAWLRRTDPS